MDTSPKTRMHFAIVSIVAIGLLCACGSPAAMPTPPAEPSEPPQTTTPPNEPSNTPDRVDVVCFHRPQRCPTCLCFEERIRYVISTCFQKELNSGELTFQVCNLGDAKNADIAKKYGAVGPQLFVNTTSDGTDHIRDIQKIWSWNCRSNKQSFDQKVKSIIEKSLKGES